MMLLFSTRPSAEPHEDVVSATSTPLSMLPTDHAW